jgi:hypothetical protein
VRASDPGSQAFYYEQGALVKRLSLEPDPDMRWIYDYTHPDYNSPRARHLRESRAAALRNAPQWMIELARLNDALEPQDLRS